MENNINSPSFRSSVGGYNRNDVNAYIMEINSRFKKALRDSEDRIRQLEKEIDEKNVKIRELSKDRSQNISGTAVNPYGTNVSDVRNRISNDLGDFYSDIASSNDNIFDSMTPISDIAGRFGFSSEKQSPDEDDNSKNDERDNKILTLTEKLSEAEALISALNERIENLREQYDDVSKKLAASGERIEELENDNKQIGIISLSDDEKNKAVMYDKLTSQVGKIILDAQQTADAMIQNAQRQSDDIIAKAEVSLSIAKESADSILKDAEKRSTDKIALADISIKESVDHFKSNFMTTVNEYFDNVDSAVEKIFSDAVENYGKKVFSKDESKTNEPK